MDIYVAGFPCQPFSVAGKRQGFEDDKGRGNAFFNILDYIKSKVPKVFILENVQGIVTLENGKCKDEILKALESVRPKYDIYDKVINTNEHGLPQNRPRWFCIGLLSKGDNGDNFEFDGFPNPISCPPITPLFDRESQPLDSETFPGQRIILR